MKGENSSHLSSRASDVTPQMVMLVVHHFGPDSSISAIIELFYLKAELCPSTASQPTFIIFVPATCMAVDLSGRFTYTVLSVIKMSSGTECSVFGHV